MAPKYKFRSKIELRFSDCDAFGHVNNANYLTYFEEARVKYFNEIVGWGYDYSKRGVILARAEIDFVMPVYFTDEVIIETGCTRLGNKSFTLEYRMTKEKEGKEILLASGSTVMVAFDYSEKKSIPIPDEWKDAIRIYEGGNLSA
jgi:acyl-CoA thioester hydrolase